MYVVWNSNSIPYVPPSHIYTCIESTHPPAPSLVENVTVTSCSVNDSTIALHIEWSPPTVVNEELDSYDVWIGTDILEPDEDRVNLDYSSVNVCAVDLIHCTLIENIFFVHACMQKEQTSFNTTVTRELTVFTRLYIQVLNVISIAQYIITHGFIVNCVDSCS